MINFEKLSQTAYLVINRRPLYDPPMTFLKTGSVLANFGYYNDRMIVMNIFGKRLKNRVHWYLNINLIGWAMLGSNQRPLRCEHSALPLS